jgi:hypothetical protein
MEKNGVLFSQEGMGFRLQPMRGLPGYDCLFARAQKLP